MLHFIPLHRDLGKGRDRSIASLRSTSSRFGEGEGSLYCFTPFRFIAIRGLGLGNRFIASLRSASSRFGEGEGSLYCFTPFRFIAIWGRGGIALLLHSVPLHRDLEKGRDRSIASLRSASSRFGGWGWGIASLLHFVLLHRDLLKGRDRSIASLRSASSRFGEGEGSLYCFTPFRFIAIWGRGRGRGLAEAISRKPSAIIPHMETINIAKRNFPSCSLCSQFTASQKLPLLFPNAKQVETRKW